MQLSLNIQLRDDATFDSFYEEGNQEIVSLLRAFSKKEGHPFVYLWGNEGRSHLLQAICHEASTNTSACYLALDKTTSPAVFEGLEQVDIVCLDDIDTLNPSAEEALFHLFNRLQQVGGRLVVSAKVSPAQLPIRLPDLKSRLASGVSYQLHSLTDEQKEHALQKRALQRGLELTEGTSRFLLSHCPRDMKELFSILDVLDKASLREKRRLTVPFIKQVLNV